MPVALGPITFFYRSDLLVGPLVLDLGEFRHRPGANLAGSCPEYGRTEHHGVFLAHENRTVAAHFPEVRKLLGSSRLAAAVIPSDFNRRQVTSGRETVPDGRLVGIRFSVGARRFGLHGERLGFAQLESPEGHVQQLTPRGSQRPGSEVEPPAPSVGMIGRIVGALGCRAEPQVPGQSGGQGRFLLGPAHALRPLWAIGPAMDLFDRAESVAPNHLDGASNSGSRMTFVAHLRRDSGFVGQPGQLTSLPDIVRERGLDIDMLLAFHRCSGDDRVGMVGGGNDDGINAFFLVQHCAEVSVLGRVGVRLEGRRGRTPVDVAEGNDVGSFAFLDVAQAPGA